MKQQTETLNMTSSVHRTDSGSWWRSKAALVMLNAIGGAAVLGSIAFCIQTTLLDALAWPAFFPV